MTPTPLLFVHPLSPLLRLIIDDDARGISLLRTVVLCVVFPLSKKKRRNVTEQCDVIPKIESRDVTLHGSEIILPS